MSEFKIGDIVQLKSGGPKMTVIEVREENEILCTWFDEKNKQEGGIFLSETLKLA